jgi:hypothetical protein
MTHFDLIPVRRRSGPTGRRVAQLTGGAGGLGRDLAEFAGRRASQ